MSGRDVGVSVICLAYNHGKYVRQTLEGFVTQKTDFKFEVIVHDDASTDDTAEIIREYAEKYPEIIRPIFQTENQYSRDVRIQNEFVRPLVQGKYVALCEGDDYWTDPQKLQLQYDILEKNPDCSMCVHRIQEINKDGTPTSLFRPESDMAEGKIETQQFLDIQRLYPFQTASYFMRAALWCDLNENPPAFRRVADVGDVPMLLYMNAHGKIYYLPRCMSVYRTFSVGSWSTVYRVIPEKRLTHAKTMYEMMRLYDEYIDHAHDCHLVLYKARVLWFAEDYRELVKREYREYLMLMRPVDRIYTYVCAVFPFMGSLRKYIVKRNAERKR